MCEARTQKSAHLSDVPTLADQACQRRWRRRHWRAQACARGCHIVNANDGSSRGREQATGTAAASAGTGCRRRRLCQQHRHEWVRVAALASRCSCCSPSELTQEAEARQGAADGCCNREPACLATAATPEPHGGTGCPVLSTGGPFATARTIGGFEWLFLERLS